VSSSGFAAKLGNEEHLGGVQQAHVAEKSFPDISPKEYPDVTRPLLPFEDRSEHAADYLPAYGAPHASGSAFGHCFHDGIPPR
jgi:hypothetical protein